jgi:hypothetical protein
MENMKTISPMELKVPVYDRSFESTLFDPLTMWMLFAQICVVLNLEKVSCVYILERGEGVMEYNCDYLRIMDLEAVSVS